nr:unnamed protein product [Digitaria exilis]
MHTVVTVESSVANSFPSRELEPHQAQVVVCFRIDSTCISEHEPLVAAQWPPATERTFLARASPTRRTALWAEATITRIHDLLHHAVIGNLVERHPVLADDDDVVPDLIVSPNTMATSELEEPRPSEVTTSPAWPPEPSTEAKKPFLLHNMCSGLVDGRRRRARATTVDGRRVDEMGRWPDGMENWQGADRRAEAEPRRGAKIMRSGFHCSIKGIGGAADKVLSRMASPRRWRRAGLGAKFESARTGTGWPSQKFGGAPNWAAPEPRLSLKKKFEALSNSRNPEIAPKHPQLPPILDPIHTKSQEIPMAGGEGSSRGKGSKRKAEAMKQIVTTEETTSAGDMPIIGDPISDWPTSILKEKHIKALETDGFLPAQGISRWRSAYGHEYPTEDTEEITGMRPVYLDYTTKESLKDWQKEWFYAWNHQPHLPPLDPTNTEEAALLARCVDPGVRDQVRMKSAIEDPDEPMVKLEPQVPEEPQAKSGATSRGTERSKRPAPSEAQAPVPKKARTLPKPQARTIPEERAKVSPQPRTTSSVEIAIGEIGTSMPQQSSSARRALSEEEILHEIFNPVSTPFEGITPIIEEPCPAGPSTAGQEVEEEFTLGEPEIPMRPSTIARRTQGCSRNNPAGSANNSASRLAAPEEAQVEETVAEVLAEIEQLVTAAVIEESERERRDQSSAQPPSVTVTTQAGAEAECSREKQTEDTTPEQAIEEIPRVPQSTGAEEEGRSFRIGSFDPMCNPNPQTFEYILDAEEDEQHIDRGLYHAERAVAYFKAVGEASRKKTEYLHNISLMHAKADRLQKELEREREDRKLQEAEDADMIRTLHLRTKELAAEREDMKKKLAAAKSELKGAQQQLATAQSKMTDWSNVANRYEEALKTLSADHEGVKEQLRVAVQQRKDADEQLIQILEQQKQLAKNLEDAREENGRLSRDLVQAQKHLADKKVLDEKLEQAARRMSELEEELRLMKKSDDDLAEALNRISQLEKAANPVVKALVPEDPATPQTFLERLKAMPRQLKAYIKRSSKACLVHVLAVVKSRYPEVDIGKLVEGAEPNCTESTFRDLKQEAEPVAEAIAQSLRL